METNVIEHDPTERQQQSSALATTQQDSMAAVIERMATNPDADVDKFERMIAMQERIFERNAEQDYSRAMASAQSEMDAIGKTEWNDQTKSFYADLGKIIQRITPVYTRHGFSLSFGTGEPRVEGCIHVTCDVFHAAGHTRRFTVDMPLDNAGIKGTVNKTGPHAMGSSMSYARRYLTMLIFNLALIGEDDDGNSAGGSRADTLPAPDVVNVGQVKNLQKAITDAGLTEEQFCQKAGINRLTELYAARFNGAMEMLKNKAEKGAAQ